MNYYDSLISNPLFNAASNDALNELALMSCFYSWPKRYCIKGASDTCHNFYIIISGRIKAYNYDLENNRQLTLMLLKDRDVIDVCTLINGNKHQIYYETIDQTKVLAIPISKMKEWLEKTPEMLSAFLDYVLQKLQTLQSFATDICLEDTSTRLAKLLIDNMNTSSNKIELINDLSHDELAQLIGTTRVVVNRHLQNLKQKGLIKVGRKDIEITDLKALQAKAGTHLYKSNY